MTNETPYPYAPIGADDEALTATRNNTQASLWSLGGPLLFFAAFAAAYVLRLNGVW